MTSPGLHLVLPPRPVLAASPSAEIIDAWLAHAQPADPDPSVEGTLWPWMTDASWQGAAGAISSQSSDSTCLVTPVYGAVGINDVRVRAVELDAVQSDNLTEILQEAAADCGIDYQVCQGYGVLTAEKAVLNIPAPPPHRCGGTSLDYWQPKGRDGAKLRQFMGNVEIALHHSDAPVKQAVNGVWLWGGGNLLEDQTHTFYTSDAVLKDLAEGAGHAFNASIHEANYAELLTPDDLDQLAHLDQCLRDRQMESLHFSIRGEGDFLLAGGYGQSVLSRVKRWFSKP